MSNVEEQLPYRLYQHVKWGISQRGLLKTFQFLFPSIIDNPAENTFTIRHHLFPPSSSGNNRPLIEYTINKNEVFQDKPALYCIEKKEGVLIPRKFLSIEYGFNEEDNDCELYLYPGKVLFETGIGLLSIPFYSDAILLSPNPALNKNTSNSYYSIFDDYVNDITVQAFNSLNIFDKGHYVVFDMLELFRPQYIRIEDSQGNIGNKRRFEFEKHRGVYFGYINRQNAFTLFNIPNKTLQIIEEDYKKPLIPGYSLGKIECFEKEGGQYQPGGITFYIEKYVDTPQNFYNLSNTIQSEYQQFVITSTTSPVLQYEKKWAFLIKIAKVQSWLFYLALQQGYKVQLQQYVSNISSNKKDMLIKALEKKFPGGTIPNTQFHSQLEELIFNNQYFSSIGLYNNERELLVKLRVCSEEIPPGSFISKDIFFDIHS